MTPKKNEKEELSVDEKKTDDAFKAFEADQKARDAEAAINLSEKDATIKLLRIAAGWDVKHFDGEVMDIDLSCFILDKENKTREDPDFVFYNNLNGAELAVRHLGDNRNGFGDEDDEAILIDLNALPYDVYRIVFTISIYMADERDQTFKMVENAFVRAVNEETDQELTRDDMSEAFGEATAVEYCEIERIGTEWHFRKLYKPVTGGLGEIARKYGCIITSIG